MHLSRFFFWLFLLLIASILCAGLYFFNNASQYHGYIENYIASRTGMQAKIKSVSTRWYKGSPRLVVEGLQLRDKRTNEIKAQFEKLSAMVDGSSILLLHPNFTELLIEKPRLVIESVPTSGLKIAGVPVKPMRQSGENIWVRKLQKWVFSQRVGAVHNAQLTWRHTDKTHSIYKNIYLNFSRDEDIRKVELRGKSERGSLGITADIIGDVTSKDDWSVVLKLLQGGDKAMNVVGKQIELNVEQGKGEFVIPSMRIERSLDVLRAFGSNSHYERLLLKMGLSGVIEHANIKFEGSLIDFENWAISGLAKNVAMRGSRDIPSIQGVRARFSLDQNGGLVDFIAENDQVALPSQFDFPLEFDEFSGSIQMRFKKTSYQMVLKNAKLINQHIQIEGATATYNHSRRKGGYLVANVPIIDGNLTAFEGYFPKKTHAKFRQWWTEAFVSNERLNGYLSYTGALGSNNSGKPFDVNGLLGELTTDNLVFDYGAKNDWPVLTSNRVKATLNNRELMITGKTVNLDEISVIGSNLKASIPELFKKDLQMQLSTDFNGALPELASFLQTGPLTRRKGKPEPKEFVSSNSGDHSGSLIIDMPFMKVNSTRVKGDLFIANGVVQLPSGVLVEEVNGQLNFTESTINANSLQANFLGGDLKANVTTLEPTQPPSVRISGVGTAHAKQLAPWMGKALASRFEGSAAWLGRVDLTKQGVMVNIESNLDGIDIDFPAPFTKNANDMMPITVSIGSGNKTKNRLDIRSKQARFNFEALSEQGGHILDSGQILFAKKMAIEKVGEPGISIAVNHSEFNLDEWILALQEISAIKSTVQPKVKFIDHLKAVDLSTENFILFGKALGKTSIQLLSNNGKQWGGDISGENLSGKLSMQPLAESAVYDMVLERLVWPHEDVQTEHTEFVLESLPSDQRLPSEMPIIDLSVKRFKAFGKELGKLNFSAGPEGDAWKIRQADFEIDGSTLLAYGAWRPVNASNVQIPRRDDLFTLKRRTRTDLSFKLDTDKTGKLLQYLGFDDLVAGGRARFLADVNWYGAPYEGKFNRINGEYQFEVSKGSFPSVSNSAGRLFGLMNINALSRRLRLDFNDVFGSGLVFDKLKSEGDMSHGDINVESFYIFAPSAYIQANGRVGLSKEDYDMNLIISPQLGGNVALFSALANPAAGALVFLAQRIFKKQLNNTLVYKYTVQGDWETPDIVQEQKAASDLSQDYGLDVEEN